MRILGKSVIVEFIRKNPEYKKILEIAYYELKELSWILDKKAGKYYQNMKQISTTEITIALEKDALSLNLIISSKLGIASIDSIQKLTTTRN